MIIGAYEHGLDPRNRVPALEQCRDLSNLIRGPGP